MRQAAEVELAEYGRIAEVEDNHWWYRNVRALVRDLLGDELRHDQLLLDAGCGPGGNSAWMKEHGRVVGLDNAHPAVQFLRQRWPATMPVQGSLSELPFRDEAFDVVTTITVVTCIPDDEAAVRELSRVLRPGGALFLIEPAFAGLRRGHDVTGHSLRRYRRRQLSDMVRAAGLQVRRATYAYSYLAPAAAVLHYTERRKLAEPTGDKGSDTRRRWLDWLFAPLATAERRWLVRHDVPVGTNSAGNPVTCESVVASGTPPSSRPARASVPSGTSATSAFAISRNNPGSDSKRYLSKYSVLVAPDRNLNRPRRWLTS